MWSAPALPPTSDFRHARVRAVGARAPLTRSITSQITQRATHTRSVSRLSVHLNLNEHIQTNAMSILGPRVSSTPRHPPTPPRRSRWGSHGHTTTSPSSLKGASAFPQLPLPNREHAELCSQHPPATSRSAPHGWHPSLLEPKGPLAAPSSMAFPIGRGVLDVRVS